MALGPGIYDDECTKVREELGADGVVLIVFGGEKGGGFSVQAPVDITLDLPSVLAILAQQIEIDLIPMKIALALSENAPKV